MNKFENLDTSLVVNKLGDGYFRLFSWLTENELTGHYFLETSLKYSPTGHDFLNAPIVYQAKVEFLSVSLSQVNYQLQQQVTNMLAYVNRQLELKS